MSGAEATGPHTGSRKWLERPPPHVSVLRTSCAHTLSMFLFVFGPGLGKSPNSTSSRAHPPNKRRLAADGICQTDRTRTASSRASGFAWRKCYGLLVSLEFPTKKGYPQKKTHPPGLDNKHPGNPTDGHNHCKLIRACSCDKFLHATQARGDTQTHLHLHV